MTTIYNAITQMMVCEICNTTEKLHLSMPILARAEAMIAFDKSHKRCRLDQKLHLCNKMSYVDYYGVLQLTWRVVTETGKVMTGWMTYEQALAEMEKL